MADATLRRDIEKAASGNEARGNEEASKIEDFLDCMAKYEKAFEPWQKRVTEILKKYRDQRKPDATDGTAGDSRFNILWSNVQTLVPATFSRLPQPDVTRRFKDQDPTGRVASEMLERSLSFEVEHYTDYRSTMSACVHDRFLGGRGTAWIRYEPHFKGVDGSGPEEGSQVTEDTDETPVDEALDYECAPIDYVHWRDFGHDVARTWEEVTRVWRNVYMSEEAVEKRFGEEVAETLSYDASPETDGNKDQAAKETQPKQACVIELWDKQEGKVYWFSKSSKKMLDEKDDPLGLQDFFPCPKPLYASLTNDTLVPVPDFTLYQDQAKTLDVLSDRITGLARMLQVKGVYDASVPELARLFTEGANGDLIAGKDWARFSEKGGLAGSIDLVELKDIYESLRACAETMEQVKAQVYEITGISDIIRGQTAASETATAQQIKGQYASLRLRAMQDDVARFATDCLKMKAQVICGKFSPTTIAAISAAEQLSDEDKQHVYVAPPAPMPVPGQIPVPPPPPTPTGPAMALLIGPERIADPSADAPNPLRSFRIEVAADTLVQLDEQREKQDRLEFVTATGAFLEKAFPILQVAPQAGPLVMNLLKFGIRSFKVGKQVEGQIDAAIDQLQMAAKAGPPPDPKVMEEQIRTQVTNELTAKNASKDIAVTKREADLDIREMKFGAEQEIAKQREKFAAEAQAMERDHSERERQLLVKEDQSNIKMATEQANESERKASEERAALEEAQKKGDSFEQKTSEMAATIQALGEGLEALKDQIMEVAKIASATRVKNVVRDKDGLIERIEEKVA